MSNKLPPCGLFRTTVAIGPIQAGRLIYFHNHGSPGPGVYPPERWQNNRAQFAKNGVTLEFPEQAETLEALAPQGLYRVRLDFHCCIRKCHLYQEGELVQLGYNTKAEPILFVPHWAESGLVFPETGTVIDPKNISRLERARVPSPDKSATESLH